jgi:hypothetical protein
VVVAANNNNAPAAAEYPNPDYCQAVLSNVPRHGACSTEEARVLCANGFVFVDVRRSVGADRSVRAYRLILGLLARAP